MGVTCSQNRDCLDVTSSVCIGSFFIHQDTRMPKALAKLWEMDKIPPKRLLTPEESACENNFSETLFKVEGRYGVRLPFKSMPNFPGSKEIALKSLSRL